MNRVETLLAELAAEHDAFLTALEAVDVDLVTVPGVVEDWSVRDLVVHVAFWAEHAADAIRLVATDRGDKFDYDTAETDAMNARLLIESRQTAPSAALEREERAFDELASALGSLDPGLLDIRLGNGDTVAEVIVYDGADHYREHTAHLLAWFGDDEGGDDEPPAAAPAR